MNAFRRRIPAGNRRQRGVATLLVALVILVILTVIVLSSSSVALFEQKTATNEYRQRLADQAAEYALNLGVEYLKANVVNLASEQPEGWLPAGTDPHWVKCEDALPFSSANHPCMSETNNGDKPASSLTELGLLGRRKQLYFYQYGGSTNVPYNSLVTVAAGQLDKVGGVFTAGANTTVSALLCRLDTTIKVSGVPAPACKATPNVLSNNRIAVTVAARSALSGENSASEMKLTLGNWDGFGVGAAVPLVASGSINGVGNAEIVAAPNGAGSASMGQQVSVWTASDADIDCSAGGSCSSVSTCNNQDYRDNGTIPEAQLMTTCAGPGNPCGCPNPVGGGGSATTEQILDLNPNFLSGHVPGATPCCENTDILDKDGNKGLSPDITFFPGYGMDDYVDLTDDSLFEWVFNVSGESNTTKTSQADTTHIGQQGVTNTGCTPISNCAINYLSSPDELGAQLVTCAQLNALGASATGLYYVTDSSALSQCSLPAQLGTPDAPALVVVNENCRMVNTLLYGMLFVRSDNNSANLVGAGHAQVFGSVVVQGTVGLMAGGFTIVFVNTNLSKLGGKLPETTRFGRLPGSWLDGAKAGF